MERIDQAELLDLGQGTDRDVAENLAEMQQFNDLFGGTRALTRHLFPRLLLHNEPVKLIDLGTGGAGLPIQLVHWARRLNISLHVLGIDLSERNLSVASRRVKRIPEISLIRADALRLPILPEHYDYIVSSLFIHHFSPQQLVKLLRDAYRLASRAVILSDLARGWLPYLGFKLVQPVFARNMLTRHDGALSIRRAYTASELRELVDQAGLPNPQVFSHFPGWISLVAEK